MVVRLYKLINGEKCFWGEYDLSSEIKAFSNAIWEFGRRGITVVVEGVSDGKET